MKQHRTLACLATMLALSLPRAQAAAPMPAEDLPRLAKLFHVEHHSYDHPDEALKSMAELEQQWGETHALSPQLAESLALAKAQAHIAANRFDPALKLADGLPPTSSGLTALIRALIAERQGKAMEAGQQALTALRLLQPPCQAEGGEAAVERGIAEGCNLYVNWTLWHVLGRSQDQQALFAKSLVSIERALLLARALKDPTRTAITLGNLAYEQDRNDQAELARRSRVQALQLAQGDLDTLTRVKIYEGASANLRGDRASQQRALEEGLQFALASQAPRTAALLRANLSDFYINTGKPERAIVLAHQALPDLLRFKDLRLEQLVHHNLAVALIRVRQFDAAHQELQHLEATPGIGQIATTTRRTRLRELGEAWADAGQWREALRLFHEEREVDREVQEAARQSQMAELKLKYDNERKQADLTLLQRDRELKNRQLANSALAERVGMAVALLLGLSLVLVVVMLRRLRQANKALQANQALLKAQSERDPLTGLANRRHFLDVMEQSAASRFQGALLMVDIDHFKHVNDEHGHAAGDAVICEVARRISAAVREEDLVVRWGGEEYLVYIPGVAAAQLQHLAERILFSVGSTAVETPDGPLRVTASIGFANFPMPPVGLSLHWERAVNWADMALYTAKATGRNRAVGIAGTAALDAEALALIEADFEAACSAARVNLVQVPGPA